MRRIIAVLLENEAGALSRVVGLFAQRNYNIDSLSVAPTEDPTLSRLTLTTVGDLNSSMRSAAEHREARDASAATAKMMADMSGGSSRVASRRS